MARQSRKISPTDYYHIMMRGNNREEIFRREDQKVYFLESLKKFGEEAPIEIAGYCLMDNHVHILIKGEIKEISAAIKRLNIRYAMKFNKEGNRIGHVFQDRYKSEVILDEPYLLQVVRYIHNNPLKAKMVKKIEDYKWSSYSDYMESKTIVIRREQRDFIMAFFANKTELFAKFHLEEDNMEFLDTKEEIENNRLEIAQAIIADYCTSKGIIDGKEIYKNPEWLEKLIRKLLEETKLSHRQIARVLEVGNNSVHKVSLEKWKSSK